MPTTLDWRESDWSGFGLSQRLVNISPSGVLDMIEGVGLHQNLQLVMKFLKNGIPNRFRSGNFTY
jgi:hypothetical protein